MEQLSDLGSGHSNHPGLCTYPPPPRYRPKFNKPFLYTILFGTCLPITCLTAPVYSLCVMLHLLDSKTGTTLFLAASSFPMTIWVTKNFMDSVPVELEEAAWVDWASMGWVYGQLAAFSLIYSLPVVIMYVIANRFLGGGILPGRKCEGMKRQLRGGGRRWDCAFRGGIRRGRVSPSVGQVISQEGMTGRYPSGRPPKCKKWTNSRPPWEVLQ